MSLLYLAGLDANLIRSASSITPSGAAHSKFGTGYLYDGTPGLPFKFNAAAADDKITIDHGSAKEVDFVSIHGHNIDSGVTAIQLRSSTDNFSGSDTLEATLTKATPAFFEYLSPSVTRRYWRIVFVGTNGNPISLGEVWLGKASVLSENPDLPYTVNYVTPQRAIETPAGQPFVENLSKDELREVSFDFFGDSSDFAEVLALYRDSKKGKEPVVIVPDSDLEDVIMGQVSNSLSKERQPPGTSYRYSLAIREYPFEQEYE